MRYIFLFILALFSISANADSGEMYTLKEYDRNAVKYTSVESVFNDPRAALFCSAQGKANCAAYVSNNAPEAVVKSIEKLSDDEFAQYVKSIGKPMDAMSVASNTLSLVIVQSLALAFFIYGIIVYIYTRQKGDEVKQKTFFSTALIGAATFLICTDLYVAHKNNTTSLLQYVTSRYAGKAFIIMDNAYESAFLEQKVYLAPIRTMDPDSKLNDMKALRDFVNCAKGQNAEELSFTLNQTGDFAYTGKKIFKNCGIEFSLGNNLEVVRLAEKNQIGNVGLEQRIQSSVTSSFQKLLAYTNTELEKIDSGFLGGETARKQSYSDYYNLPNKMASFYFLQLADYVADGSGSSREKSVCDANRDLGYGYLLVKDIVNTQNNAIESCVNANSSKSITEQIAAVYLANTAIPAFQRYVQLGALSAVQANNMSYVYPNENYKRLLKDTSFSFDLYDLEIDNSDEVTNTNNLNVSFSLSSSGDFGKRNFEDLFNSYEDEYNKQNLYEKTIYPVNALFETDKGFLGSTEFTECSKFYNFNVRTESGFNCGSFYDAPRRFGRELLMFSAEAAAHLGSSKLAQAATSRRVAAGGEKSVTKDLLTRAAAAFGTDAAIALYKEPGTDPAGQVEAKKWYNNELTLLMGAQIALKPTVFDPLISGVLTRIMWFSFLFASIDLVQLIFFTVGFVAVFCTVTVAICFMPVFIVANLHQKVEQQRADPVTVYLQIIATLIMFIFSAYFAVILCNTVIPIIVSTLIRLSQIQFLLGSDGYEASFEGMIDYAVTIIVYVIVYAYFTFKIFGNMITLYRKADNLASGRDMDEVATDETNLINQKAKIKQ